MLAEFFVHDGGDTEHGASGPRATSVLAVGRIVGRWCARQRTLLRCQRHALPPLNVHQRCRRDRAQPGARPLCDGSADAHGTARRSPRASLVERVRACLMVNADRQPLGSLVRP